MPTLVGKVGSLIQVDFVYSDGWAQRTDNNKPSSRHRAQPILKGILISSVGSAVSFSFSLLSSALSGDSIVIAGHQVHVVVGK